MGEKALVHSEREGEGVTGSCVFKRGKGEQALVHSESEGGRGNMHLCVQLGRGRG